LWTIPHVCPIPLPPFLLLLLLLLLLHRVFQHFGDDDWHVASTVEVGSELDEPQALLNDGP